MEKRSLWIIDSQTADTYRDAVIVSQRFLTQRKIYRGFADALVPKNEQQRAPTVQFTLQRGIK